MKQIYAKEPDLILEYEKNRHKGKHGNVILVYNRDRSYIAFITRNGNGQGVQNENGGYQKRKRKTKRQHNRKRGRKRRHKNEELNTKLIQQHVLSQNKQTENFIQLVN